MTGTGFRRPIYGRNHAAVAVPPFSPRRVVNNVNVCGAHDWIPPIPVYWLPYPLPLPPPDRFALVVLTVTNTNAILDDAWDFMVNGVKVATYDGGGQTTLTYSAYLPKGQSYSLSAVVATEQNDNRFDVFLEVNGDNQISQDVVTDGYVGETRDHGSFFTW